MRAPSPGVAGGSAAQESSRRRRGSRWRRAVGVGVGGAGLAALVGAPPGRPAGAVAVVASAVVVAAWPSRAARWAAGAAGERATARALEGVEGEGYTVLHDVRLRGRRWNLDHVLLGPAGVVIVETKQWRRTTTVHGRWPRIVEDRVGWQIDALAAALRAGGHGDVTVHGFVCVHGARVRRRWWTGARNAPIGDGRHLRRWLRRLPASPGRPDDLGRKVFEERR